MIKDRTQDELTRRAEVKLRMGIRLMGRDKKTIQDLISLVNLPPN
jgi:hypothetical protein